MVAAWPAGRASPAAGPPGLLRTLWLVTIAAGHWGSAASGAVGSEETPKCEDLRVGQYPPESRPCQALSRTRGCGMGTVASAVALGTMDPGRVSGLWRPRAEPCDPSLARPVAGTSLSDGQCFYRCARLFKRTSLLCPRDWNCKN